MAIAEPLVNIEVLSLPTGVQVPKVVIPKSKVTNTNKNVKKTRGRMCRKPLPRLYKTQHIVPASTSQFSQGLTAHQIIMPPPQTSGITYQIYLDDHTKIANNSVQYALLESQPVFLQQTPTSVSIPSSVVSSQPSDVNIQPYKLRERNILPKIPKTVKQVNNCSFCYKRYKNMNEHIKNCQFNPDSRNYKFRKIAPYNPS